MTKQIPLTQGKYALVDNDVYEWASKHKWHARRDRKTWYAGRFVGVWPFRKAVYLHREIMQAPSGVMVDHINGDGLNCTRANMRLASNTENQYNRSRPTNNTSGYKGVDCYKGKWRARISLNGRVVYLGMFTDPKVAARAYDEAAREYHGTFAKTNFQ